MNANLKRVGSSALTVLVGLFTVDLKAGESKGEVQVLFIGNSFTYYHDLPKMVAELAKVGGQRTLRFERETPGGCTLEKHWKDGKAQAKIQSRKWDFVVLQDHSQAVFKQHDSMFDYGKKFDAEIKRQGAKTILYMTWALQNKPDTQPAIAKAYQELAKELKGQVAPVGIAWASALGADKKLVLHEKDQKHPNVTGTYLAACVFYATIYGKSPEGLAGRMGGMTDEQARPLQAIVWKTVHVSAVTAGDAKDEAIKKDRKQIEGTWRAIALEVNGNKQKEEDANKITVVNGSDGTWSLLSEGKEISKGISTFDPTKKPKTLDFTATEGEGKGNDYLGIYELGEKTRKMCFAEPGKERPTEFSSQAGSGHILVTFEREKAK